MTETETPVRTNQNRRKFAWLCKGKVVSSGREFEELFKCYWDPEIEGMREHVMQTASIKFTAEAGEEYHVESAELQ